MKIWCYCSISSLYRLFTANCQSKKCRYFLKKTKQNNPQRHASPVGHHSKPVCTKHAITCCPLCSITAPWEQSEARYQLSVCVVFCVSEARASNVCKRLFIYLRFFFFLKPCELGRGESNYSGSHVNRACGDKTIILCHTRTSWFENANTRQSLLLLLHVRSLDDW